MADLTRGHSFTVNEELTNTKLNNLVDDATLSDVVQADLANNHGLVVRSGTAPTDTDALHFDTDSNQLRVYGTSWQTLLDTTTLQNRDAADSNCLGYLDGCQIGRKDKNELYIYPGSVAIGNGIYLEQTVITVDISAAWAAGGTTGGYDSGIATNAQQNDTWYYVYLTTTTGDTSGFQILIDNITDTTPTDATLGTDARLIGMYYHKDATTGIQMIHNFRVEYVEGWGYMAGDGTGGVDSTDVSFGVTFVFPPFVFCNSLGSISTATVPVGTSSFTTSESSVATCYDIGVTDIDVRTWLVSDGDTSAAKNYGYSFIAYGQWEV